MRRDPAFGKVTGSVSVAIGVFALIGFHLLAGWKCYRLSNDPA